MPARDDEKVKAHLLDLARRLDVRGRSRMTKPQLVDALQRANDRATAEADRKRAGRKRTASG
jgi:hypothetical protein